MKVVVWVTVYEVVDVAHSPDAPQQKKTRSASPTQPHSTGPPSSDSVPPASATATPSQPTPPQPLTEATPHGGQGVGGAVGGGGQECPSGASSQRAVDVGAAGTDPQEGAPVQHHDAASNAESYDFTVSTEEWVCTRTVLERVHRLLCSSPTLLLSCQ